MKKNNIPYKAIPNFVLRTPLFSFDFYKELTSKKVLNDDTLKKVFQNQVIKEAVFLASPTLYFEIEKWVEGKLPLKKATKAKLSLLKYLTRMSTRCTPFGLFAGCTTGSFNESTAISLHSLDHYSRYTRPDMNYLVALSQDLAKKDLIKQQLTYFPNSSLYESGNQLRYIEYFYVDSRRRHQIVEIDNSPYLKKLLNKAAEGAVLQELLEELIDDDINETEAKEFLEELLKSQVLVSELEPSVSGPPIVNQIHKVLENKKGCEAEIHFLKQLHEQFLTLDKAIGNPISLYLDLSEKLKAQPTKFELKYLFQTDLELNAEKCELSNDCLEDLYKALMLFNRITKAPTETNLTRFRDAFYERYEEREMPLCHVLDVESGIGYLQNQGNGDVNPLIDDLVLPEREQKFQETNFSWNVVHQRLKNKMEDASRIGKKKIVLEDADFKDLPVLWDDLPDSLSAMTEIIVEEGKTKIKLSGFGGSSAANLLGRFCHEGSSITDITQSIVEKEISMNPRKILGEIVHLPEARVGNVLMRPSFRKYEIPYLAKSNLAITNQIPLDDLFISVRNNQIFLRSKNHDKEVIPHLTNAHNYSVNALPIYQFLCDLQTQGLRNSIGFDFGPLSRTSSFLPRVEYGNLILQEARWQINKEDILELLNARHDMETLINEVGRFQKDKELPQYVLLSDGDNELLINFENVTSVQMLLETVKNRGRFILAEFLHCEPGPVRSSKGHYVNQMVFSFLNQHKLDRISESKMEKHVEA